LLATTLVGAPHSPSKTDVNALMGGRPLAMRGRPRGFHPAFP